MIPLDTWITDAISGSLLLAIPVAVFAGLVSFFSPCVLPLLPAYLSYATGLSAADVVAGEASRRKGRMLAGTSLFVLGFAIVFVLTGAVFGGIGSTLIRHGRIVEVIGGVLCIGLGLIFADLVPIGRNDVRPARIASVGLAAALPLGMAFGIGWTPCIGPTLSVVLTLALNEGSAGRGALLAFVYALGMGLPFILAGLAFRRFAGAIGWVKRHQRTIQRAGGVIMIIIGVLLISGIWNALVKNLQSVVAAWGVPI